MLEWMLQSMTDWRAESMLDWMLDWSLESSIDWMADWMTQWSTDWRLDWMLQRMLDWSGIRTASGSGTELAGGKDLGRGRASNPSPQGKGPGRGGLDQGPRRGVPRFLESALTSGQRRVSLYRRKE